MNSWIVSIKIIFNTIFLNNLLVCMEQNNHKERTKNLGTASSQYQNPCLTLGSFVSNYSLP